MFDVHHHFLEKKGIYNLDFGQEIPNAFFSVGLHPKDIQTDFQSQLDWMREISLHPKCKAIGECGLDALVAVSQVLQEQVFEAQILWANKIQKPVIIHCVRKYSELMRFQKIAKVPLVVHGFNKKENVARELLNKGFYLSFGKALLRNEGLQKVAKSTPLEKIFLETDVWEGNVEDVYETVAKIKNIDIETLENQVIENLRQVFGLNCN